MAPTKSSRVVTGGNLRPTSDDQNIMQSDPEIGNQNIEISEVTLVTEQRKLKELQKRTNELRQKRVNLLEQVAAVDAEILDNKAEVVKTKLSIDLKEKQKDINTDGDEVFGITLEDKERQKIYMELARDVQNGMDPKIFLEKSLQVIQYGKTILKGTGGARVTELQQPSTSSAEFADDPAADTDSPSIAVNHDIVRDDKKRSGEKNIRADMKGLARVSIKKTTRQEKIDKLKKKVSKLLKESEIMLNSYKSKRPEY